MITETFRGSPEAVEEEVRRWIKANNISKPPEGVRCYGTILDDGTRYVEQTLTATVH